MSIIKLSKPFNSKYKQTITDMVIDEIKSKSNLNIRQDPSFESGFNLPFNEKWLLFDFGHHLNRLREYHDSRQLRYHDDGQRVYALGFKDGIKYWDNEEIEILMNTLNKILASNNFN